jgi:predicted nucleotidyltransferase
VESWPEFNPEGLLRRLVARGVDFVVVGGMAMVLHGSARLTRDLDICYSTDPANLEALGATLVEISAHLRDVPEDVPFVPDGGTLRRTTILALDSDDGRIDLLASPAGAPPYPQLRERATRTTFDGRAILIASLEDLESMKRAAGRAQDLLDLEEIEVIRRLTRRPPRT